MSDSTPSRAVGPPATDTVIVGGAPCACGTMTPMRTEKAEVNGLTIAFETFGDRSAPTVLLISGLGVQMLGWDEGFCALLVGRGFHVVRFDNRDVGGSTWLDTPGFDATGAIAKAFGGDASDAPYRLEDMADDAVGLLDHLGVDRAHVVGASMGGMIAQTMAITHRERVASLTSVMSTTGEPDVGQPDPSLLGLFVGQRPLDRDGSIAYGMDVLRAISGVHFDESRALARTIGEVDRGINPLAVTRQLLAIIATGPRVEGLESLDLPALVVHGRRDRLIDFSGGKRTAQLVAGSDLLAIDDMAHDIPAPHWSRIADAIADVAHRSS